MCHIVTLTDLHTIWIGSSPIFRQRNKKWGLGIEMTCSRSKSSKWSEVCFLHHTCCAFCCRLGQTLPSCFQLLFSPLTVLNLKGSACLTFGSNSSLPTNPNLGNTVSPAIPHFPSIQVCLCVWSIPTHPIWLESMALISQSLKNHYFE